MTTSKSDLPPHVIFYDGVCALCNGLVRLMVRVDRAQRFHFAPLQGETAELARRLVPEFPEGLESVVYLKQGEVLLRSKAATSALRQVPYPTKALSWIGVLPTGLTDAIYRFVAAVRYRVFGRYDHCPLPTEQHRLRFLP